MSPVRQPKGKAPRVAKVSKSQRPPVFLVIHTGGLGDIVLSATLFSALKHQYPNCRTVLLTRSAFVGIAQLFPFPPDQVIPLPFDPSREVIPNDQLMGKLTNQVATLRKLSPSTMIAADLEPTWLGWFLGSALLPVRAVVCARNSPPRGLLPILID